MTSDDKWFLGVSFLQDGACFTDSEIKARFPGLVVWDWKNSGKDNSDLYIKHFQAKWTVPPEPKNRSDQFIALFSGMKPYDIEKDKGLILKQIIQPVLRWGGDNGQQSWSVSSYFVQVLVDFKKNDKNPDVKVIFVSNTNPVPVSPGTVLIGRITQKKSPEDSETNGLYTCVCEFDGLPGTGLTVEIPDELVWVSVALETKNINSCDKLPSATLTSYEEIIIESNEKKIYPEWRILSRDAGCNTRSEVVTHNNIQDQVDIYYK